MARRLPVCQKCGEHVMTNFEVVEYRYYRRYLAPETYSRRITCDSSLIRCMSCENTWRSSASYVKDLKDGGYARN